MYSPMRKDANQNVPIIQWMNLYLSVENEASDESDQYAYIEESRLTEMVSRAKQCMNQKREKNWYYICLL